MSGIAQSNYRYVATSVQSALGTQSATTATDAKKSRRKNFTINFTKSTFESGEKTTDGQEHDFGHGQFIVAGDINGELYAAEWQREWECIARRDMTALGISQAATGDGFTLVGSTGVLTRAGAGNFITDGHRVGHIGGLGAIATTADIGAPAQIIAMASDGKSLTLDRLDGKQFTDISVADENATFNGIGLGTFIPQSATAKTEPCLTIEDHHADTDISALYYDTRLSKVSLKISPNNYADVTFSYVGTGDNSDLTGVNAPYFTSPSEPGLYRGLTGIRAVIRIGGVRISLATAMSMDIDLGCLAPEVIAAQVSPDVFYGQKAKCMGEFTAYIKDNTMRAAFRNETYLPVSITLFSPDFSQFVSFYMGKVKLNSNTKDDPETGIQQTVSYRALRPDPVTGTTDSVILIQDSSAS